MVSSMGAALIAPIALVALIAPGVSAGRSPLRAYDCSAPFAEGAYTLHWALERPQRCAAAADCPPSHIRLGVQLELRGQTATAAHARGWWVAFGISEAGGLRGVDMVRYDAPPAAAGARANGTTARLVDAHTRASAQMLPDAQQDWALERAPDVAYTPPSLGQGGLTRLVALVPMRRALRTSDRQFDRALAEDSRLPQLATNVVGQWGVGAYDGERAARERAPTLVARGARVLKPARGAAERGGEAAYVSAQLRLHRRQCDTPLEALRRETPGLRRVRVRMRERVIPPPEPSDRSGASAYTLECFDVADLLRDGTRAAVGAAGRVDETDAADDGGGGGALHALAFEARVWPPSNERHVHHISLQTRAAGCAERPPAAQPDAFLASWTPGMEPAVLPAGAGVRMGGPGAPRALVLVLHAEPRGGGALEPDSSGFIMYFVRAPASRARDAAVIEISATDGLMGAPLPIGSSRLRLSRPVVAPAAAHASTEPVTVFMAAAHMHALGVRARLTVRAANGSVVRVDSVRARAAHHCASAATQLAARARARSTAHSRPHALSAARRRPAPWLRVARRWTTTTPRPRWRPRRAPPAAASPSSPATPSSTSATSKMTATDVTRSERARRRARRVARLGSARATRCATCSSGTTRRLRQRACACQTRALRASARVSAAASASEHVRRAHKPTAPLPPLPPRLGRPGGCIRAAAWSAAATLEPSWRPATWTVLRYCARAWCTATRRPPHHQASGDMQAAMMMRRTSD